jgi:hypothetical protein
MLDHPLVIAMKCGPRVEGVVIVDDAAQSMRRASTAPKSLPR